MKTRSACSPSIRVARRLRRGHRRRAGGGGRQARGRRAASPPGRRRAEAGDRRLRPSPAAASSRPPRRARGRSRQAEAGELDVELEIDQTLQLDREDLPVPAGVERELVVGKHVGAALGGAQVRQAQRRDLFQPRSLAASTRPCPAMISPSSVISTGLVNPNRSIELAICLTCFFEWVRALRG